MGPLQDSKVSISLEGIFLTLSKYFLFSENDTKTSWGKRWKNNSEPSHIFATMQLTFSLLDETDLI